MIRFRRAPNDGGDHGCEGNYREKCCVVSGRRAEQLEALTGKGRGPAHAKRPA
jgi:hypothetical protein